jgi:hypothetical protein
VDLDQLLMRGLATLRTKQNFANKPSVITFSYNNPEKAVLYFTCKIKSSQSDHMYTIKLKIHDVSYSATADKVHKYQIKHPQLGIVYLGPVKGSNKVTIRCTCPDDYFMWQYPNKINKALIGKFTPYVRVPGSTRPPKNPLRRVGGCKHTLRLIEWLVNQKIVHVNPNTKKFINDSFKGVNNVKNQQTKLKFNKTK